MPTLPETFNRYVKFFSLIMKYRSSDVFDSAAASAFDEVKAEDSEEDNNATAQNPQELVEDLKKMGPTYVKLGQLLSTRPDLLPDEYLEALATLQDDVATIPYEEVKKIVEEDLGVTISKAFQSFDEAPLASASIGQVHKGVLRSGKEVAVKVQRPGVRKNFLEDLDTLQEMTAMAVKYNKSARRYSADDIVEELRHILLQELDYTKEAQNLVILGKNLEEFENIIVPQPVDDYSSGRMLTMDYVQGQKITNISGLRKTEKDYYPLVDEFVEAYLKQIIVDGFAQADPHPGNVHITQDDKIVLMDLGMVAKFSPTMQENLLKLLIAMSQNNGDAITDTLLAMSFYEKVVDTGNFRKNINRLVMDNQSRLASDMQTGRLLIQMNRLAANCEIKLPVQLNILGKILLNMDQIVSTLAPKFDLQEAIRRHVQKMMRQKMTSELKPENLLGVLVETKRLTRNLPERLNKITERLANNEFELKIDAIDEQRFTDGFQKVANRITLGLIIAALIIGAAMLVRVPTSFTIWGYPAIAMILFLISAIGGILLAWRIMKNDEDFKLKKK